MGQRGVLIAEPQLFVTDIAASCAFFARIGFAAAFVHGDPPFYAQVAREGARLNLRHVDGPVFDPAFRVHEADALAATIVADAIAPLYTEFAAAGVEFHQKLRPEPWGAQTFILADPDGNLIAFAGG
ncbi:VOC family protein [Sphingomonas sp.]|jgi:catechol 2,3-dioxygenase-like lactoylglutathione lyase family enzyme|uniref:VOC family protein n=1 Tax=Sphingomonas sp. TaxID=28214 RepID=UPI002E3639D2|nr:VOC family protein [Sphingomonas sp.]HEX4694297.1 VOC family protein [Sphingomonas sp.]